MFIFETFESWWIVKTVGLPRALTFKLQSVFAQLKGSQIRRRRLLRHNFRNVLHVATADSRIGISHERRKHIGSGLVASVADEGGPSHMLRGRMRHRGHIDHRAFAFVTLGLRGLVSHGDRPKF